MLAASITEGAFCFYFLTTPFTREKRTRSLRNEVAERAPLACPLPFAAMRACLSDRVCR